MELDSSHSGSSSEGEDEIVAALSRRKRRKIARAIRERSPIAERIRSKRDPVLQAPLRQAVGNPGPIYIKVLYSLIELEQWKATVRKYKENPDKVANLVEREINTQNPDWSDLKAMMRHCLIPLRDRWLIRLLQTRWNQA